MESVSIKKILAISLVVFNIIMTLFLVWNKLATMFVLLEFFTQFVYTHVVQNFEKKEVQLLSLKNRAPMLRDSNSPCLCSLNIVQGMLYWLWRPDLMKICQVNCCLTLIFRKFKSNEDLLCEYDMNIYMDITLLWINLYYKYNSIFFFISVLIFLHICAIRKTNGGMSWNENKWIAEIQKKIIKWIDCNEIEKTTQNRWIAINEKTIEKLQNW